MSSGRFKIAPTEDELQAAESMIEALLADTSEERDQNIAAWKEANMPTVRNLLREQFDMMLHQMATRMESDGRRESMSQTLQRQFPRFEVTVYATFQGIDGKRMVRESPDMRDEQRDDIESGRRARTGASAYTSNVASARRPGPSPNDNRSNAMNPNNAGSRATANNRSNQMNSNNSAYRSSRR